MNVRGGVQEAEVVALPRIILKRWPGAGIDILVRPGMTISQPHTEMRDDHTHSHEAVEKDSIAQEVESCGACCSPTALTH